MNKTQIHATGPELYLELSGLCIQTQAAGSSFSVSLFWRLRRGEGKKKKEIWLEG